MSDKPTLLETLEEVAQASALYAAALIAGAGDGIVDMARGDIWNRRAARLRDHARRLAQIMADVDADRELLWQGTEVVDTVTRINGGKVTP